MNQEQRRIRELEDLNRRLVRQCSDLQIRNRELEIALNQIFKVAREQAR